MLQLQGLNQRRTMTAARSMLLLPVLLTLFADTAAAPTPPHAGAGELSRIRRATRVTIGPDTLVANVGNLR
jgi:hypothetical protein